MLCLGAAPHPGPGIFLLAGSWGPQGPWECGIPRPKPLRGPAVGLATSQATVKSFYLFPPHSGAGLISS